MNTAQIRTVSLKHLELEKITQIAGFKRQNEVNLTKSPIQVYAYCMGYTPVSARHFDEKAHPPSALIYFNGLYSWLPITGNVRRNIEANLIPKIECPYCTGYRKAERDSFNPEER